MAKKSTTKPVTNEPEQEVYETPVEVQEPVASGKIEIPELEVFKKISMLSSLASACEDQNLLNAFNKLKHGSKLYEIFVKAVHQEIQGVISGQEQRATQQMASVQEMAGSVYGMVQTMYNMMSAASNSPMMKVLAIVHDRMTGTSFEDALAQSVAKQKQRETQEYTQQAQLAAQQAAQAAQQVQQPQQAPQQPTPQSQMPVQKYADGRGQPQPKYSNQGDKVPAPTIPPRGRNIEGIF